MVALQWPGGIRITRSGRDWAQHRDLGKLTWRVDGDTAQWELRCAQGCDPSRSPASKYDAHRCSLNQTRSLLISGSRCQRAHGGGCGGGDPEEKAGGADQQCQRPGGLIRGGGQGQRGGAGQEHFLGGPPPDDPRGKAAPGDLHRTWAEVGPGPGVNSL